MAELFGFPDHLKNQKFARSFSEANHEFVSFQDLKSLCGRKAERVSRCSIEQNLVSSDREKIRVITDPEIITDLISNYHNPSHRALLKGETTNISRHFQSTENRFALIAEFAIVAVIACAAIARVRDDPEDHLESLDSNIEELAYRKREDQTPISLRDMASLSGSLSDYMFASKEERPTIILGKSDTLVKIAEMMFHDFRIAWLIAELNEDRTRQIKKNQKLIVEIELEEVLRLPFSEDIEDFYKRNTTNLNRENLKTVIKNSKIHRALIEKELKPIVAPEINWPVSKITFVKLKHKKDRIAFDSFRKNPNTSKVNLNTIIQKGIALSRSIDD